jgi:hypothetical protein
VASVEKVEGIASLSQQSGIQGAHGNNLPARHAPPSQSRMADDTWNSPMNVAGMLKRARELAAADTIARQAEARAALAGPSTQPSAMSQMLPLRKPAEVPSLASPSSRNSSETESIPKPLHILSLGPEEYVVPLPLNSITRNIYDGEVINFRHQQMAFVKGDAADDAMIHEIDSVLDRLKALCDHQDLIRSDLSTQETDPVEVQAAWAENISTKCVFLSSFLSLLRPYNIRVAIVAHHGRMLDILEAVLRKEGCIYRRPNRPDFVHDGARGSMRVTLLPNDFHKQSIEVEPVDIVIAFSSMFEKEQFPKILREDSQRPGSLAPLVHLTVIRSIEHFELCFDKRMDPVERRTALLCCVLQSRHEVGVLPPGYYSPPAAGTDVGIFAGAAVRDRSWPLRAMPDIEGIELALDTSEEIQAREVQPSELRAQSYNTPSAQVLQVAFKRSLVCNTYLSLVCILTLHRVLRKMMMMHRQSAYGLPQLMMHPAEV